MGQQEWGPEEDFTMARYEVRIAGFGGQGVVLSGIVLGTAAMYGDKFSTQVQSYGPEARGGACKTEVVISDEEISFPMVTRPDFFIALSQEALDKYIADVPEGKTLIVDEDLVKKIPERKGVTIHRLPMTRVADRKVKNRAFTNIVMLGAVTGLTRLVSREALREAVKNIVPKATIEKNLTALDEGFLLSEAVRS
jgi:2-oxoglutarate ferredoxin oxidoreductase subunit gamma